MRGFNGSPLCRDRNQAICDDSSFANHAPTMCNRLMRLSVFCFVMLLSAVASAQVRVLVDHVGYEASGPKQGLVEVEAGDSAAAAPSRFVLQDAKTGKSVLVGALVAAGEVKR